MAMTLDGTNGVTTPAGLVINNAPAFSVYQSTLQALPATTFTKLRLQTKEYDTNTNFDVVTNFRFTPTVSGYYQISAGFQVSASVSVMQMTIYKNGTAYKNGAQTGASGGSGVSALVFFNGSTDYIEFYVSSGIAQNTAAGALYTWATGAMVRGA